MINYSSKTKSANVVINKILTVKYKLIITILVAVLLPLSILGFFSYRKAYEILDKKLELTTSQNINEVNKGLREFFKGIEGNIAALGDNSSIKKMVKEQNIEGGELTQGSKEIALELFKNFKDNNPVMDYMYFGASNKSMYIYPKIDLPADYDPTSRPWYKSAVDNKGKVIWTDPYIDEVTKSLIISAAKAVIDGDKVLGVLTADFNLQQLSDRLAKTSVGREGYIFLVDRKGTIIIHPKADMIGKSVTEYTYWQDMKSKESWFTEYKNLGKKEYLTFVTDNSTGWKLAAVMNEGELLADTNSILDFTRFCFIIGVVLALILALLTANIITKPLNALKDAFAKAAIGDLRVEVNINSRDEFEIVAKSFNQMINNINLLIKSIKEASSTVLKSSASLADITAQTNTATNEVALAIEQIAKSAGEQAKDAESGAVKVNELADRVEMVTKSTDKMNLISSQTNVLSDKGTEAVKLLIEKSRENNLAATEVGEIVFEVDSKVAEIGIMTQAIGQIATQTNLLALNAAIEAARAGENGKGFAVVADEIRKLAEEAAKSVKEINHLITGIQASSNTAVAAMERAKLIVDDHDKAVSETNNIFNQISGSIKEILEKIEDIKECNKGMIIKKDEIVDVIGNISAVAQETSAATEEVSASTEEQLASIEEVTVYARDLSELADKLQKSVERFKLD